MNKRIKQKTIISLAAKIVAKMVKPGIKGVKVTRAEKKVFRKNRAYVMHLVRVTHKDYFKN